MPYGVRHSPDLECWWVIVASVPKAEERMPSMDVLKLLCVVVPNDSIVCSVDMLGAAESKEIVSSSLGVVFVLDSFDDGGLLERTCCDTVEPRVSLEATILPVNASHALAIRDADWSKGADCVWGWSMECEWAGAVPGDSAKTITVLVSAERGVCFGLACRRGSDDSCMSTWLALDLVGNVDCFLAICDELMSGRREESSDGESAISELRAVCIRRAI